jgi:hypothetical protein
MHTVWPAEGRFMAVTSGSGLDADLPVLLRLPLVAAYQVQVVAAAESTGDSVSLAAGAGVPAGAVGSTGGTSARAVGAWRASRVSDTMVPRRKLVIMVGTSLVALQIDELGRPWTTHHHTATDDDRGTLLASNPPDDGAG